MSVKMSGLVWDVPLPRDEKMLLLCYADHANHDGGSIYPSKERVEHMTGYSRRSVQTITATLVKKGVLIEDGTADRGVVRYRLNVELLTELAEFPVNSCQVCGAERHICTHHIHPQAWGGGDGKRNRIRLCLDCHAAMHLSKEQTLSELGFLMLHEGVAAVREKMGAQKLRPANFHTAGAQKTADGGAKSAPNPPKEPPKEPSGIVAQAQAGELFTEPEVEHPEIHPNMRSPGLLVAWGEWKQHRKQKRQPLTPLAMKKQVAELVRWVAMGGERLAVLAIEHSVKNGYTGLFLPKGAEQKTSPAARGPITKENALRMPGKPGAPQTQ